MTARTPGERHHEVVESELDRERAAVLGRYGRRVEDAIARCGTLLAALDGGDANALESYRAERQAARRAVADLCLQREMLGLNDHAWVHRIYQVPSSR